MTNIEIRAALFEAVAEVLRRRGVGDVVRVTDVDTFAGMSSGCCGNDGSPYTIIEISYLSTSNRSRQHEYDGGLSSLLDELS